MKKVSLTIIILVVCLTISGQQINQSTNYYRRGDMVEKKQVTVKGFSLKGNNDVWSLEDADISKETCQTEYITDYDTIMELERGNRTYYNIDKHTISIIGSENYMELMSYDMSETWLKFPMQKGDSISGYFNGTGKYCDRLFIRRFGTYMTKADAEGKLVLPGGDTLRNVIRLHTERWVGAVAAPIDTMKCKIPAFTVDSIITHLAPDTAKVREDVYRWYADGYRYPILESKTVSYLGKTLSEEMYYCPPEMQELLAFDEENKKTRARLEKENSNGNGGSGKGNNSPEGFKYHISQDEGSGTVTVSYSSDADIRVDALLASSQGYVYRRASQSDGSEITLSYRGLPRGQYIIHITAGKEKFAEKFHVR